MGRARRNCRGGDRPSQAPHGVAGVSVVYGVERRLRHVLEWIEELLSDRLRGVTGGIVAGAMVPAPDYVAFAAHYGFAPDFCEAGDPESKGVVEHLVGYAKSDLLVGLGPSLTSVMRRWSGPSPTAASGLPTWGPSSRPGPSVSRPRAAGAALEGAAGGGRSGPSRPRPSRRGDEPPGPSGPRARPRGGPRAPEARGGAEDGARGAAGSRRSSAGHPRNSCARSSRPRSPRVMPPTRPPGARLRASR